jgi:hypothetical protein
MLKYSFILVYTCVCSSLLFSQDLKTYFEKSDYKRTPRYDSTLIFAKKLAQSATFITFKTIGKSHEGRDIPLLIAAKGKEFTPAMAKKSGKNIILIQACIHAGEPDGKDAGFLLFRDFIQKPEINKLLDDNIVLFIPIFNVDGHERYGAFNRINQNGPEEMGWRTNAHNLNLNRDYLKAQSPEMKAWLNLFYTWEPDFFIDCHVTDGADYQYPITYAMEIYGNMNDSITRWQKDLFLPSLNKRMVDAGYPIMRYVGFRTWFDFESGLEAGVTPPILSHGLTALVECPGLLIESHMLKDYKTRVLGTYEMLKNTLTLLKEQKVPFKRMRKSSCEPLNIPKKYTVTYKASSDSIMVNFLGVEYTVEKSDLTGGKWFKYSKVPKTYQLPLFDKIIPSKIVDVPRYYVIPKAWADVFIPLLTLHRIKFDSLKKDTIINSIFYRFSNVKLASTSYEGCQRVNSFDIDTFSNKTHLLKGSLMVPVNQPHYKVLIHLIEPEATSSLLSFGYFNSIFEQKEYGESYVLEVLAREMLKNPDIKKQYEQALEKNPSMKSNSYEILNWFYMHSAFADPYLNVYPISKIF